MHWVSVVVLHCMVWNRKHSESLKNGFKNEKKKGYKQGETVSTCPNLLNSLERIKFRITLIPITGEKPYSSLITSIEYWKFPNLIIFPVPPHDYQPIPLDNVLHAPTSKRNRCYQRLQVSFPRENALSNENSHSTVS